MKIKIKDNRYSLTSQIILIDEYSKIVNENEITIKQGEYYGKFLYQCNEDRSPIFEIELEKREEEDSLGKMKIEQSLYYGIQTRRAMLNFNISNNRLYQYPDLIRSLGIIKLCAIKSLKKNFPEDLYENLILSCKDLINGFFPMENFDIDMIQGGAGTSINMCINEIIANRTLELMGDDKGRYDLCSPNDHVNMAQSTNDVYPTAIKMTLGMQYEEIKSSISFLQLSLYEKSTEFKDVLKMGRTQLQDAVPMTLGQEFKSFQSLLSTDFNKKIFKVINIGGTAIGTSINVPNGYIDNFLYHIRVETGLNYEIDNDLISASSNTDSIVEYSSYLKRIALKLSKICNDLRLLTSGPVAGLNEINLPMVQPGSSIMPGKVNPVIPEVVNQVCYKVIGNDTTISMASENGQLQLNVMEPIMFQSIYESTTLLNNAIKTLNDKCIKGITANEEVCKNNVINSYAIATYLNPVLGYKLVCDLIKESKIKNKTIYQLIIDNNIMNVNELDKLIKNKH